jgi:threonyl-tRNA synthetase
VQLTGALASRRADTSPSSPSNAATDHRVLGRQFDLFSLSANGVSWRPRGVKLLSALEVAVQGVYRAARFAEVRVPAGGLIDCAVAELESYRHLPLRRFELVRSLAENSPHYGVSRDERSADQAVVLCLPEQIAEEAALLLRAFGLLASALGCEVTRIEVLGDGPALRAAVRDVFTEQSVFITPTAGEARVELHLGAGGRSWPAASIRMVNSDRGRPQRGSYRSANNRKAQPVVLQASLLGSLERLVASLLEVGELPLWLVPEQVRVLAVEAGQVPYALTVAQHLCNAGLRGAVDDSALDSTDDVTQSLARRVRNAELLGVGRILIVGKREAANGTVTLRGGGEHELDQLTEHLIEDAHFVARASQLFNRTPEEI